jgi:hypothetical protein
MVLCECTRAAFFAAVRLAPDLVEGKGGIWHITRFACFVLAVPCSKLAQPVATTVVLRYPLAVTLVLSRNPSMHNTYVLSGFFACVR